MGCGTSNNSKEKSSSSEKTNGKNNVAKHNSSKDVDDRKGTLSA